MPGWISFSMCLHLSAGAARSSGRMLASVHINLCSLQLTFRLLVSNLLTSQFLVASCMLLTEELGLRGKANAQAKYLVRRIVLCKRINLHTSRLDRYALQGGKLSSRGQQGMSTKSVWDVPENHRALLVFPMICKCLAAVSSARGSAARLWTVWTTSCGWKHPSCHLLRAPGRIHRNKDAPEELHEESKSNGTRVKRSAGLRM